MTQAVHESSPVPEEREEREEDSYDHEENGFWMLPIIWVSVGNDNVGVRFYRIVHVHLVFCMFCLKCFL